MKKTLFFLLAALVLTSCSSAGTTDSSTDTAVPTAETELPYDEYGLPKSLDFGGETMGVCVGNYNDAYFSDLYSAEETGNRFSDAIYYMLKGVEDRLNIKLEYQNDYYSYDDGAQQRMRITSAIMAGDDWMDLIISANTYTTAVQEGEYFMDLNDLPYVNMEQPWYNQTVVQNMPTDYIYFALGSFSIANVKNTYGLFFNQTLLQTMEIDTDLYAMVDEGTWTIDALSTLVKDTYLDLDGNMKKTVGDQYGMTFGDYNKYLGLVPAFDIHVFEKTDEGYVFTYNSERAASALTRMCEWINKTNDVAPAKFSLAADAADWFISSGGGNGVNRVFMEGRALFSASLLADAETIVSEIDFEYGLLPYPKWDENQLDYQTTLQRAAYALIPTTADAEKSSALLEALTAASYRELIPEYCEVSLKTRYSQDNDTSRMYDLIINSIVYDPGEIFGSQLGAPTGLFRDSIFLNQPNWASKMEANEQKFISKMSEIVGQ